MVHEHRADAAAGEQVVHVVVRPQEVGHLGLQLGVDGGQLLVDRLQFFLGGFQFLVGGLQLFVDGLHFLVRRLEFFGGGLQFLVGALEIFLLGAEFGLERGDALGGVRRNGAVHPGREVVGRGGVRRRCRGRERGFFEDDQKERRLCGRARAGGHRPDGEVDGGDVAVRLHAPAGAGGGFPVAAALCSVVVSSRRKPSRAILRMLLMPASPGLGSRNMPVRPCR